MWQLECRVGGLTGYICRVDYTVEFDIFFFFQAEDGIRDLTVTGVQTCALPISQAPAAPGMSFNLIVGGQGALVRLGSSGTSYNSGTQSFTSSVTVENLIAQPMSTADGTTPDAGGIKVFFHSGPTVTGGTGTVSLVNFDGVGTFTAANQEYFLYSDGVLPSGEST